MVPTVTFIFLHYKLYSFLICVLSVRFKMSACVCVCEHSHTRSEICIMSIAGFIHIMVAVLLKLCQLVYSLVKMNYMPDLMKLASRRYLKMFNHRLKTVFVV